MVKLSSGYGRNENRDGLGQRALDSFTNRMRAAGPLGAKVFVFYAVWILVTYGLGELADTASLKQIIAIGYWFGWLFAGLTVAFAVFVLTIGVFRDVRR